MDLLCAFVSAGFLSFLAFGPSLKADDVETGGMPSDPLPRTLLSGSQATSTSRVLARMVSADLEGGGATTTAGRHAAGFRNPNHDSPLQR